MDNDEDSLLLSAASRILCQHYRAVRERAEEETNLMRQESSDYRILLAEAEEKVFQLERKLALSRDLDKTCANRPRADSAMTFMEAETRSGEARPEQSLVFEHLKLGDQGYVNMQHDDDRTGALVADDSLQRLRQKSSCKEMEVIGEIKEWRLSEIVDIRPIRRLSSHRGTTLPREGSIALQGRELKRTWEAVVVKEEEQHEDKPTGQQELQPPSRHLTALDATESKIGQPKTATLGRVFETPPIAETQFAPNVFKKRRKRGKRKPKPKVETPAAILSKQVDPSIRRKDPVCDPCRSSNLTCSSHQPCGHCILTQNWRDTCCLYSVCKEADKCDKPDCDYVHPEQQTYRTHEDPRPSKRLRMIDTHVPNHDQATSRWKSIVCIHCWERNWACDGSAQCRTCRDQNIRCLHICCHEGQTCPSEQCPMLHQGDWNSDDPAWEVVNGSLEQQPGGPWAKIDRDANADLIPRGNVILDPPPNG